MDHLWQDLRYAVRTLLKTPGVTLIAVGALALGIGVNTTVFSCVNALFLRPFPYREPERLLSIVSVNPTRGWDQASVSYPDFADWREQARSFEGMFAHASRTFNLSSEQNEPERLEGEAVSANAFRVLGLTPILGRDFLDPEDQPGAGHVALLSYALWQRRFGGDSGILGRALTMNGVSYTVIGVMPPPILFPEDQQLWVPLALDRTQYRGSQYLEVIGRLQPGVSIGQANAELRAIARRLEQQYPEDKNWTARTMPVRERTVGAYRFVLAIMMAAVGFVLLIACANVANLLLARATARQREIAIRVALGAGRWRIVRQLLTESILLALGGATLGLLIALWGLDLIVAAVPGDKPFWMVFTLDSRVLLFTLAVALGTGVLFGLAPALQAAQIDLQHTLKDGTRGAGATGRRQRLRNALVVAEVALSLVLLVGATLMVRSFLRVQAVDPGFDRRSLVMASTYLAGTRYDSLPRRAAFYTNLVSGLRALPGVTGVTAVGNPPLGNSSNHSSFTVEGRATPIGEEPVANWAPVMPAYATVMGIPLLQGRDIAVRDLTDSAQVVLVNRWLADRFWPGGDAVGKRLRFGNSDESAWMTVIGVVGNVQQRQLDRPPEDELYVPYTQSPWRGMAVVMRTATGLTGAGRQLRDAVSAADPQLPVFAVMTFEAAYRSSMWEKRLYGWMFGAFAGIALLLAAVGLYGVMAYMVTLRTHEIGVRMALGARARDVLRLVVRRGVVLTAIGVAIGLGGAFAVTSLLRNLLFGVSPTDLVTFIGIPLLLGAVALLASTIPALRAARIDPMLALRYE